MKLRSLAAAIALAAPSAALAATAVGSWTTGSTWDEYVPSENNLLQLRYLVQNGEHNDFYICKEFNSEWGNRGSGTSAGWGYSAHAVTLRFPSKATISAFNFYTQWGDAGRVNISMNSVKVRHSSDGEWETLENSRVDYAGSKTLNDDGSPTNPQRRFALFAAEDGSPLAEDVVELQMDFPTQQNSGVGYVGIEVVGTLAEDPGEPPESETVWDAGGFDASTWQPLAAESNMMAYVSSIQKDGKATTYYDYMIDGKIDRCKADGNYLVSSGQKVAWLFAKPITLQSFSVFASWGDDGDGVGIFHFDTLDADGVWTEHLLPKDYVLVGTAFGFETHEGGDGYNYATLRRRDGEPIATDVLGIRVLAFFERTACWAEVEAEGWTDTSPAVFDERSVTVATDCWDVTWTAKLTSLGASDQATVNLWTSLDNATFTLADSQVVTETDIAYAFRQTLSDVNQTLYYKFETINAKDGREWRSTNTVASVVNPDNATYYWKPSVTSGVWEDAANWTNNRNDTRLKWPTDKYTTADFTSLASGASATVEVGVAHTPRLVLAPLGAEVVFTGAAGVTLSPAALPNGITGRMVVDTMGLSVSSVAEFADGAGLVAQNGASLYMASYRLNGAQSRLELLSGATLRSSGSTHSHLSGGSEILLNGGSVTEAGYFVWSGTGASNDGCLTFGLGGGTFRATQAHCKEYAGTCTFRYVLPGGKWEGYGEAPLQPKSVNATEYHRFGNVSTRGGAFRVELVAGGGVLRPELEIPLIEMVDKDVINTNYFEFVAFGKEMKAGVPNGRGDCFYWTYDGGDSREPATEGALPTGLRFHHAERGGAVLIVR